MQLEIGDIREGKVTGITKFGIFVELEKGITGLVHISEISKSFVVDVFKVVRRGDIVKVKILSYENNKLSLSIKQAGGLLENTEKSKEQKEEKKQKNEIKNITNFKESINKKEDANLSFEDMLAKFKKTSEEKMSDIRKNLDGKRSSYSKKR